MTRDESPSACRYGDSDVLPALLRYRERYQWGWNLSMRLINLYYGTQYTEKQLKALYRTATGSLPSPPKF